MSSTFRPQDLKSSICDSRFGREKWSWSAGSLRHVIKALGGIKVAAELDNMTGWTLVGATLTDALDDRLTVVTEEAKTSYNPQGITRYFMPKVGVIVGLDFCSRYDAIESERREHELARQLFQSKHPELPVGELTIRSKARGVSVHHRPESYRDSSTWEEYSLEDIKAASPCEHCVTLSLDYDNLHEKHCPVYIAAHAARAAAK